MQKHYILLISLVLSGYINAQNLVAHYTFNNGSVQDVTNNRNHAKNNSVRPTYDIDIEENGAIAFDSTSHLTLPTDILLNDQLSVSLWFKISGPGVILGTQNAEPLDTGATANSWVPTIYIDHQKILRAGFWTGNSAQKLFSTTNYANNQWHHLVLIADRNRQYLYIDNRNVATEFYNRTVLPSLRYAQIGLGKTANWPNNGGETWMDFEGGKMDNIRIYNGAISPFAVRDIYNAEKANTQSINFGLVAQYKFDNGTMFDNSQNDNTGVNSGTVPASDINSNTNEAVSFTTNNYIGLPTGILLKQNISVSLWFKTNDRCSLLGYQAGSALSGARTYVPIIYIDDNNSLKSAFWSGAKRNVNNSTNNYADGNWHHLVLTADASQQQLFVDNQLINTSNIGHTVLSSMVNAQLGMAKTENWPIVNNTQWLGFHGGTLDNVRIYHNTIDVAKVNLIYQAEKAQTITSVFSDNETSTLAIYPNPASDYILLPKGQIHIIDALGNIMLSQESDGRVNVSALVPGVYIVSQNGKKQKIIIE